VLFAGAVFNFVSFLFNPPRAPALIGFLVMTKSPSSANDPGRIRRAIVNGGLVVTSWFAGFAIAWIAKWMFAAPVLGSESIVRELVIAAAGSEYHLPAMARQVQILTPTLFVLSNGFSHLEACIVVSWGGGGGHPGVGYGDPSAEHDGHSRFPDPASTAPYPGGLGRNNAAS
jgi:hypothetical protein